MKFLIDELAGDADLINQAIEISFLQNGGFEIARYDLPAA